MRSPPCGKKGPPPLQLGFRLSRQSHRCFQWAVHFAIHFGEASVDAAERPLPENLSRLPSRLFLAAGQKSTQFISEDHFIS